MDIAGLLNPDDTKTSPRNKRHLPSIHTHPHNHKTAATQSSSANVSHSSTNVARFPQPVLTPEHSGASTTDSRLSSCPSKPPSAKGRRGRPCVIYTDKEMYFIRHHLNDLGKTWKTVYKAFFDKFPCHPKQHVRTMRVKYYAFLKEKGYRLPRKKDTR
ncbi:hypothetical protein E8E15_001899 [Penicillium rubens]|nr:hypothetical protein E8E15_001899 [Penicillium rubens]